MLQNLTDEQRERYLKFEKLFEQDGWKLIVEWANQQATNQMLRGAEGRNINDVAEARGMRTVYTEIVSMRDRVDTEFQQMAEAQQAESRAQDEEAFE